MSARTPFRVFGCPALRLSVFAIAVGGACGGREAAVSTGDSVGAGGGGSSSSGTPAGAGGSDVIDAGLADVSLATAGSTGMGGIGGHPAGAGGYAGTGAGGIGEAGGGGGAPAAGSGGLGGGGSAPDAGSAPDQCHVDRDCPAPPCPLPGCQISCILGEEGFRRCVTFIYPLVADCASAPMPCCSSYRDCTASPNGRCIPYRYQSCVGGPPSPGNRCVYDACQADSDCSERPHGFCTGNIPRACVYGPCSTAADCDRAPGGTCVMRRLVPSCQSEVVYCRYDTDTCRSDADCNDGSGLDQMCAPNADLHGARCITRPPPPPADMP